MGIPQTELDALIKIGDTLQAMLLCQYHALTHANEELRRIVGTGACTEPPRPEEPPTLE